ncbi:MAG TPA: hypothetical protein VK934_05440 [Fimbriimonas sp.]|nr:hypothetical protein [Fimbriimonas sp.]
MRRLMKVFGGRGLMFACGFLLLAIGSPASAQTASTPISLSIATYVSAAVYNGATLVGSPPQSVTSTVDIARVSNQASLTANTWSNQRVVVSSNVGYTLIGSCSTITRSTKTLNSLVRFGTALTGGSDVASPVVGSKSASATTYYIRLYLNGTQALANGEAGTYTGTVSISFSQSG